LTYSNKRDYNQNIKATVSLKQLRTNPREFTRLLNSGYEVAITEHRKTLASAVDPQANGKPKPGDAREILRVIQSMPPIIILDPELDTVTAIKQAKTAYLQEKQHRLSS
jgi:hypothetical protein